MIVSLTAYNRPDLLEQVLDSLADAKARFELERGGENVHLVAQVEPSAYGSYITGMIAGQKIFDGSVHVLLNSERLGLQLNTKQVLKRAWALADTIGEDFVLHLEDDLLIAPDALLFSAWARDEYRAAEDIRFVGLTSVLRAPPVEDWHRAFRTGWFDCHGWGTWRDVWEHDLRPSWPDEWWDHWAARVNDEEMFGGEQLLPCLSRSCSIGVHGEHCNTDYHVRHNPELYAGDVEVPEGRFFEDGHWPGDAIPYEGPEVGRRRMLP